MTLSSSSSSFLLVCYEQVYGIHLLFIALHHSRSSAVLCTSREIDDDTRSLNICSLFLTRDILPQLHSSCNNFSHNTSFLRLTSRGWLSGRVVRTVYSQLAVEGSPTGHDTAWLFISETGDRLWRVNCLGCNHHHLRQLSLASLWGR